MKLLLQRRSISGRFLLTALAALLTAACGGSTPFALTAPTLTVGPGGTIQFSVTGSGSGNVTWMVDGLTGGSSSTGTISATGLYQAPGFPTPSGQVTVSAQSVKKSKKLASEIITLTFALPALTAVTPPAAFSDPAALSITLAGSGFSPSSTVLADVTGLDVTFVSTSELTALVPGNIRTAGALGLVVSNPAPGGGTSSTLVLPIFDVGVVTQTGNVQVARYTINSPVDATVTVEFGLDTNYGRQTWTLPTPGGGGTVEMLVAGMKSFNLYNMRAIVDFSGGVHFDQNQTFNTGGIVPALLPEMTLTVSDTITPTPGVVYSGLFRGTPGTRALVTDKDGEVLWFYRNPDMTFPIGFLANGNFAHAEQPAPGVSALRIVDLAGDTVFFTLASDLNQKLVELGFEPVVTSFHHDVRILPNGNLLLLTVVAKELTDLVGFEGQAIRVLGDTAVVLDANLDPVWTWSAFNHLDVDRHPMNCLDDRGICDWTHGNALIYTPADGNLIMSLRHQHWIIKIDFQDGIGTGNVLWKHGSDGDFALLNGGDDAWQYGQHFPVVLDDTIGVYRMAAYDNGNQRPTDPAGIFCEDDPDVACFSRAVVFELDEMMMTSRIVWEDTLPFYSSFLGSIQLLGTDRIFHDSGGIGGPSAVPPVATIREVTMDSSPPVIIWQMDVVGQGVYRSFHMPSLYPGIQW